MPWRVPMRLILDGRSDSRSWAAVRIRDIRSRDLFHRRAGLEGGGTASLLLGNGVRISLAVLDMLALHARCADERLAGTRLCERHNERAFLAHDFRVAPIWVVLNGLVRHLDLPEWGPATGV